MNVIISYFRLMLFLAGVLIGIQVPGFVNQYGKSLESHYLESQKSLGEFRKDAEKYFDGDMEKLIAHYKKDGDPVFTAGGESIDSIYQRNIKLKTALEDFRQGSLSAYTHVFLSPVADIRQEVRRNYSYIVKLNPAAVTVGLIGGLVITLLAELLLRGFINLISVLKTRVA